MGAREKRKYSKESTIATLTPDAFNKGIVSDHL